MVYVEPAGGTPGHLQPRVQVPSSSPSRRRADHQGDVFANWMPTLPEDQRPKTAAYPTLDDPFTTPTSEGIEKILAGAGIETVYRETYPADTEATSTRSPTRSRRRTPTSSSQGAQFEDGVGMMRAISRSASPPSGCTRPTRRRSASSTPTASAPENTEGVFYAVSHSQEANTPGNAEFVKGYQEKFGDEAVPEDAADAYAAGAGAAGGGRGERRSSATTSSSWPTGCARTRSRRSSGTLSWNEDGSPKGEFLIGQWQDGKAEIVLPEEAATDATRSVEGVMKPGGQ